MRVVRALKVVASLALLFEFLAVGAPAAAQRSSPPAAVAAQAPTGGRAYVTDPFASTVTVINTTTFA